MKKLYFVCIVISLLSSCATKKEILHEEPTPQVYEDVQEIIETKTNWIDETLSKLSLEQKVGQMIMPRGYGYFLNSETDEYQRMINLIKNKHVGGFCFFQGEVYATASTINKLQEISDIPLLIAADFERGGTMRIQRMTPFPEAMAIGAANKIDLTFKMGEIVALEARAIGIHINFAPVVDINNNPFNPVINTRSYGESPELVTSIAKAYMSGMQKSGLIAVAKHFPGHGDTDVDSHYDLPVLNVTRSRLDSIELYPYKELIQNGLMGVMTGHLALPKIDQNKLLPASLSQNITKRILIDNLSFKGLVVTDALEMKGVTKLYGTEDAAVAAVQAGADILLLPDDENKAVDAVISAVKDGKILQARIDSSVRKILAIKQWLKLDENRFVDLNKIPNIVSKPEHWKIAKEIAQASITVVKNNKAIPIQTRKKTLILIITDTEDYRTDINRPDNPKSTERAGDYFLSLFRARSSNYKTIRISNQTNKMELDTILAQTNTYQNIIFALFVKMRGRTNPFGISQHIINFINSISNTKLNNQKLIAISFGNPYTISTIYNYDAAILTYSDNELSTESAIEVLFGEIKAQGKLPVSIPDLRTATRKTLYAIGTGENTSKTILHEGKIPFKEEKFDKIDRLIENAIKEKAFPGCQILVAKKGEIIFRKNYGKLNYLKKSEDVTDSTIYDLASLTKVIGTTSAIMKLLDEGKINLDDRVVKYIPEFSSNNKENITISNLLLHNSGLPAWQRFYLICKSTSETIDSIYNSKLNFKPGDSTLYSDLGFIVLGKIIEKITGTTLDEYLNKEFFEPLEMVNTMFKPSEKILNRIAPTEIDTIWRKRTIHGTVHDETADLLGGVAGHAGLFSNALDLAKFVQMILNNGSYGGIEFIKPETIRLFTERKSLSEKRGLGWDFKSVNGYSSAGDLFSPKSFGHTGFTGTSIWVDPERELFVIFLTNRVHPTRTNNKITKIRSQLHDAVVEMIK